MKVAISTLMIQRGKTGIAQYVFALTRALQRFADTHSFQLYVLEEDFALFSHLDDRIRRIPVPERYRPAVRNIGWHQTMLPRLLAAEKVDVVHVPSYRRLIWPRPCALVGTIHDLAPFRVAAKYDPLRMFYGRVIVRRLAHRQHMVIAISENTARDIRLFFRLRDDQLTVIWNGLAHERFFPGDGESARAEISAKLGIQNPFFLYVSRLEHPGKNHARLIGAYEKFRADSSVRWELVFAGGDWHGSDVIRSRAAASPYREDIRFLGFVPDADLPQLYRAASAVVYPSLYEGFGLPPVEAMACGCPVISSTSGSLAEVVAEAAERVDPLSEVDMARALRDVAMNPQRREQLIQAGLKNAARFDWNETAARTVSVYERALAKHAVSA